MVRRTVFDGVVGGAGLCGARTAAVALVALRRPCALSASVRCCECACSRVVAPVERARPAAAAALRTSGSATPAGSRNHVRRSNSSDLLTETAALLRARYPAARALESSEPIGARLRVAAQLGAHDNTVRRSR